MSKAAESAHKVYH